MSNRLNISDWKTSIAASLSTGHITSEDFEGFTQALNELDIARKLIETGSCSICRSVYSSLEDANRKIKELESEKQHAENLARYYHDKIIQRDQRIVELKKEKLKAKDDGYEKGWDDALRDGER